MADLNIPDTVARQYRASLAMMGQAIEMCPESLWLAPEYPNRFWRVAYHALFYTHLYLQPGEADFHPWAKHEQDYQNLGSRLSVSQETPGMGTPYTKAEVLEYQAICCAEVEARVPTLDLGRASGFHWLPFNKVELQFYNIRHLQHHTGQLADRLRTVTDTGIAWVSSD